MKNSEHAYGIDDIRNGGLDEVLERLYGGQFIDEQRRRYADLIRAAEQRLGEGPFLLFSSPGRSELGGNHTDHNRGRVLAAGIHLDKIAAVHPRDDMRTRILNLEGAEQVEADLNDLQPREEERNTAEALVRGCAAYLSELGYMIGGFDALIDSRVAIGSGLSSSASFEMLIAAILNSLYNSGAVETTAAAIAGQYAENRFFGKPSGLMDQLACALGAIQFIDLRNPQQPDAQAVQADFSSRGYRLCTLDTGGSHADLTDAYAAIPREMRCAAGVLGVKELRDSSQEELLGRLSEVRSACGDRAVLRALHFFQDNQRVVRMYSALREGDMRGYLREVAESGRSSRTQLQNCAACGAADEQPIPLALSLSEVLSPGGVFRVHGGGFAGSIQGYVPEGEWQRYVEGMEAVFGKGSVTPLYIRPCGAVQLTAGRDGA
jgi:galactokinase